MFKSLGRIAATLFGLFAATASASNANAQQVTQESTGQQQSLEVVTVTARRVLENEQVVPISVTALDPSTLNDARIADLNALDNIVPNLQVYKTQDNSNTYGIYIRGVGRNFGLFNQEAPVGLYVDDVVYPYQVGPVIDVGGLQGVEVLRGPQGTLYGRNATVGAVKYETQRPDLDNTFGTFSGTAGNFGREEAQATMSTPLIDGTLGLITSVGIRDYDGYTTDLTTGAKVNGTHTIAGRTSLLWQPQSNLSIFASIDGTHADDPIGMAAPVVVGAGNVVTPYFGSYYLTQSSNLLPRINNTDALGGTVQATWDLGDLTLKSITAFRGFTQDYALNAPGRTNVTDSSSFVADTGDHTFTQELQATGSAWSGRLSYVGGLFYLEGHTQNFVSQPQLANTPLWNTHQSVNSYAAYLDMVFKLTPEWSISAGARDTADDKTDRQSLTSKTTNFSVPDLTKGWGSVTYKVETDYKITNDIFAYSSYGTGFKGGAINSVQPASAAAADVFIPPEKDNDLEVGGKTEWFDHRLRLNADYFWEAYKNMTTPITLPSGLAALAAADADINGFELDLTALPLPQWNITGTLGTLNSRYVHAQPGNPVFTLTDPTLQHAPPLAYHISTNYSFYELPVPGSLTLGVDYSWTGFTYNSAAHNVVTTEQPYDLLGFKVVYAPNEHHEIVIEGTNVTNTVWFELGSSLNTQYIQPPAEYSITYRYKF